MDVKEALRNPQPEPGEIYDAVLKAADKGKIKEIREAALTDFNKQREFANARLTYYLSNISDSPGARKIVEEFYQKEFGLSIDASDPEALENEIESINAIVEDSKLPAITKEQIRHEFGVEGVWGNEDEITGEELPYLAPEWVKEHPEEPYIIVQTSGTTGAPYGRAVTRNDWGMVIALAVRMFDEMLEENGIDPQETNVSSVLPGGHVATESFNESLEYLNTNVASADFEKLQSDDPDVRKKEGGRLIEHVNKGTYSVVISSVTNLLNGGMGEAIKAGEVPADLYVNVGHPFEKKDQKILEDTGASTEDVFGETEYPQGGGRYTTENGSKGFHLPLDAQMNLVLDSDKGELAKEGKGRFSYLPFGLEGHPVPGVYVAGVEANLERKNRGVNLIGDLNRVKDPGRKTSYFS